ncbi:hypothetical protein DNK06_06795 [Pseudomonas daroniae]|uniref:DUF6795 domain-containing protein n=2 Tax=Pseudomonadales TaxID=72274 RepID=A0A4Q9QNL1_9GAMM|nr:hypothetical protein DNK06_06795 [Pseudomonas daroniae]TBU84353.1 hypothetical protein DNK31_08380 [Pseudomonas sp. FRB 228]TBU89854.1 hypothetical protein DNJ99_14970 [Pseudomonas daroniae]
MLVLLGLLLQGQAMAFGKTLYLFSEVEGIVLLDGQPVEGVEVERICHWKDELKTERMLTDALGRYHFPEITAKSLLWSLLPHEPVVFQLLRIHHQGKLHKGWDFTKHNYDSLGEVKNHRLKFVCDLNSEPAAHRETESFGSCILQDSELEGHTN